MSGDISALYGQGIPTDQPDAATGEEFAPLAPGWYPVQIDSAEIKDTKAGTGKFLKLAFTVIGDTYNNRKLFTNINLVNQNPKAVEIGMRELCGLGQACGLATVQDCSEMIGKTIDVRVKIGKAKNGYDADNEIGAYALVGAKSSSASAAPAPAAPAPAQTAAAAAAPAAAAPAKLPWE